MKTNIGKSRFSTDDKIKIAVITFLITTATFFISVLFLLKSLMSRPLHGTPPSLMVYTIPIIVTVFVGLVSLLVSFRFYGRQHRSLGELNKDVNAKENLQERK